MTKVKLDLYAINLKNVAGAFKGVSDPYAIVTVLPSDPSEKPQILGKTEVIKNCLSPRWTTCFKLDYEIGTINRFHVSVFDEIRKSTDKLMGSATFEVGEVLGSRGNTKAKNIREGGAIFARISPLPDDEMGQLHLRIQGHHLEATRRMRKKTNPFFSIQAQTEAAGGMTWHPVYRSNKLDDNNNPLWEPFSVDLDRVCGGNLQKTLRIEVSDWDKKGKHRFIGAIETSVEAIIASRTNNSQFELKASDGSISGNISFTTAILDSGTEKRYSSVSNSLPDQHIQPEMLNAAPLSSPSTYIPADNAANAPGPFVPSYSESAPVMTPAFVQPSAPVEDLSSGPLPPPLPPPRARPRFVDYITGGCEVELGFAIDFTGSNGDPRKPGTLHYIHRDGQLNDYEKALTAVGAIIGKYDSDQNFPVWGFGAKYSGQIYHCFQVGKKAELHGLSEVLHAYRSVFQSGLTMSGPTVFTEVIDMAAAQSRSKRDANAQVGKQFYKVLLILTDGAVSDIDATVRSLHSASDVPLSVVIVGIGNEDFSGMRFLDNFQDHTAGGRDICSFVEFSKFSHDKRQLTREILKEIPDQLVDYFFNRGIMPLPPTSTSQLSLAISEADEEEIDLSINVNSEGEIHLGDYNLPQFDETRFDTYEKYAPSYSNSFSQSSSSFSQTSSPAIPQQDPPPFSQALSAPPPYSQASSGYPSHFQQTSVTAPSSNIFHVVVPQGVTAGQKLQVRNPVNNQMLVVTVPPGVRPGGKFGVQY